MQLSSSSFTIYLKIMHYGSHSKRVNNTTEIWLMVNGLGVLINKLYGFISDLFTPVLEDISRNGSRLGTFLGE